MEVLSDVDRVESRFDEDILHYYPLAKTQQKRAKWPSCSRGDDRVSL
jgi:hypothetical protein